MGVGVVVFVGFYLAFVAFGVYLLICGSHRRHQNDFVGRIYRFFSVEMSFRAKSVVRRVLPDVKWEENVFSRYFVFVFFVVMYWVLAFVGLRRFYPIMHLVSSVPEVRRMAFVILLPFPWFFVALILILNPGYVTSETVESYLAIYPFDNIIYKPKLCYTLGIPAVARSRFCKYTNHRIA